MSGSPIIRSGDLRAENRYRILATLRRDGPLSRTTLGERTSLSQAAISTLSGQLAIEGVLDGDNGSRPARSATRPASRDSSPAPAVDGPTRRGRPQTLVALEPDSASALIVSLSIDRLRIALVDYGGTETHVRERGLDTRALDARTLLRSVGDSVARLVRQAPPGRIMHIGVAFQGTTANASGDLLWSPVIGARHVPLGTALARRFGVPVTVNNDCALIARALRQTHADVLGGSFATLLFRHGVGLGITLDGQPFAGIHSSALELGHLPFERGGARCRCGRHGCIEAYAADYGIVRLAGSGPLDADPPGRVDPAELDDLVAAARRGEVPAMQSLAVAGAAVGEGLCMLFMLLDPMPVALVGRSDEALALMNDSLHGTLEAGGHGEPPPVLVGFADGEPLLHAGTALDALDALDRRVAARTVAAATDPGARRPARARAAGEPR